MKKKFLSFILFSALLVSMIPMSAYAASESNPSQNQDQLVEAYNNILETFSKAENGQYIYPEEYRSQVRNMKDEDIRTVAVIQKSNIVDVGTDGNVDQVKNDILSMIPAVSNSISTTDIPLTVTYKSFNISAPNENDDNQIVPYAIPTLTGGTTLSSNGCRFTLGICGKYNGNPAVLTCGHGQAVGKSVTANGSVIGSVVKVNYSSRGYYDYSIIQLNSSAAAKATNKVKTQSSSQTITSINKSSVEGMTVNRYGSTSGFKTGTVLATDMSVTYENVVCYGLVEVSADSTSQPGDSGGPVYYGSNLYGIVKGHSSTGVWYYSPSGAVSGFSLCHSSCAFIIISMVE